MRENFIACPVFSGYGLMKGVLIVYLLILFLKVVIGVSYQALLYCTILKQTTIYEKCQEIL